jgi:hypothetical protein
VYDTEKSFEAFGKTLSRVVGLPDVDFSAMLSKTEAPARHGSSVTLIDRASPRRRHAQVPVFAALSARW